MQLKIINLHSIPNKKYYSSWELNDSLVKQDLYLDDIIKNVKASQVLTNYNKWQHKTFYINDTCTLYLYAHTFWTKLSNIINELDQKDFDYVYVAINKYLLYPEDQIDQTLPDDYNQAIASYMSKHLKTYEILDFKYTINEKGNVGNFVHPDSRFLCKKL